MCRHHPSHRNPFRFRCFLVPLASRATCIPSRPTTAVSRCARSSPRSSRSRGHRSSPPLDSPSISSPTEATGRALQVDGACSKAQRP
eukprot:2491524-Rhodomonas_salina.3